MAPRSTIERLDDAQFDWLVRNILAGLTDRELEAAFGKQFDGQKLAKSSIARWRANAGEQLVEKFRIARWTAKQLKEDLGQPDADSFALTIENLEDHLLTASREVFMSDPIKALGLRMEDKKIGLKQQELALKERELEMRQELQNRQANEKADRFGVAKLVWEFLLAFCVQHEPAAADVLTRHSPEILKGLGEQLEAQG
jgi:hypothetical protein